MGFCCSQTSQVPASLFAVQHGGSDALEHTKGICPCRVNVSILGSLTLIQELQAFKSAKIHAREVGTTGCANRSSAEVQLGPLPVCYEVPSTGNHHIEKIFPYDCSANFNRQVLHANISRLSSKWKKFFTWPGDLNLIACFLSSL